jgi:hypothetical protein
MFGHPLGHERFFSLTAAILPVTLRAVSTGVFCTHFRVRDAPICRWTRYCAQNCTARSMWRNHAHENTSKKCEWTRTFILKEVCRRRRVSGRNESAAHYNEPFVISARNSSQSGMPDVLVSKLFSLLDPVHITSSSASLLPFCETAS